MWSFDFQYYFEVRKDERGGMREAGEIPNEWDAWSWSLKNAQRMVRCSFAVQQVKCAGCLFSYWRKGLSFHLSNEELISQAALLSNFSLLLLQFNVQFMFQISYAYTFFPSIHKVYGRWCICGTQCLPVKLEFWANKLRRYHLVVK